MNRSHLTPEQRPTKDGNLVTRWVRRDEKQSAAIGLLPALALPKGRTDEQKAATKKAAEEFVAQHRIPKDETKEQKAARKAKNKLNAGYLAAEAKLRFKHRKDDTINDYQVNDLFKHLTAAGVIEPKSVDEDLLRDYSTFKANVHDAQFEQSEAAGGKADVEAYRENADKLGAHYANNPRDREGLNEIVKRGITDYDTVVSELWRRLGEWDRLQ